jgi:hypothetical protein
MAANVGGAVHTDHRTFEVDLPELEAFLAEPKRHNWTYTQRQVIGVEVVCVEEPSP